MGMVVRTNMAGLNANNALNAASRTQQNAMQKLASGFRINKAADDASGLSISEKMKNQIKALDTAVDNSEDGANMIQTTEGYMAEAHDMINRMVELSEKAANGVLDQTDRDALQDEMDELCAEIDRMATTANFNGKKLMDGSIGSNGMVKITSDSTGNHYSVSDKAPTDNNNNNVKVMVGTFTASGAINELKGSAKDELISKVTAAAEAVANAAGITGTKTIKVAVNKNGDILVDEVEKSLSSGVGLGGNKLTDDDIALLKTVGYSGADALTTSDSITAPMVSAVTAYNSTNISKAASEVAGANGTDVYSATTNKDGYTLIDVNVAPTSTTSATVNEGIKLQIGESSTASDKISVEVGSFHTNTLLGGIDGFVNYTASDTGETDSGAVAATKANATSTFDNAITVDITDQNKASAAADALRQVSNYVSDQRGKLGAQQNRLEHTVNNLTTASENITASNSRIRDTNMAEEMMNYTSKNVIAQAAQAMLAQANSQPQNVLSLLQ